MVLNNSYSVNRKEINLPIWQRLSITASDLLVLLWLANPSQSYVKSKSMLAMTSLSANVIKYRSERYPSHTVISKIQDRIARLQIQNNISEESIAKLCIRMAEGEIDNNEAERLLTLSSPELLSYIDKITEKEEAYLKAEEENKELSTENESLKAMLLQEKNSKKILRMRIYGLLYVFAIVLVYIVGVKFVNSTPLHWREYLPHIIYWLFTTVCVNWYNHLYFVYGIVSFFNRDWVMRKIQKD